LTEHLVDFISENSRRRAIGKNNRALLVNTDNRVRSRFCDNPVLLFASAQFYLDSLALDAVSNSI
jgi:hypothetical protein